MVFYRLIKARQKSPMPPMSSSPPKSPSPSVSRRREGAAAVEFALVAFPFFGLLLAILEVALILTVSAILDAAVLNSGRLVRTGQMPPDSTRQDFEREICQRMSVFSSLCYQRIQIDLRPVVSFSNPGIEDPIKDGVFDSSKTQINTGEARNLMLMRVWYRQPILSPFLGHAMSRMGNGDTLLHATTAFRNEPYA